MAQRKRKTKRRIRFIKAKHSLGRRDENQNSWAQRQAARYQTGGRAKSKRKTKQ